MRRDTLETRNRIINAAEKLFARRGIDAVSLSDINRAAQQKNRNAVHYHFGDKDTLINAVLDKHSERVELLRAKLLDASGAATTLHQAIEALVLPVADRLDDADGGVAFIKINAQLMANEDYVALRLTRERRLRQARRLGDLLATLLPVIPREQARARRLLTDCMLFQGLADYATRRTDISREAFIQTLVNSIERVLSAPG